MGDTIFSHKIEILSQQLNQLKQDAATGSGELVAKLPAIFEDFENTLDELSQEHTAEVAKLGALLKQEISVRTRTGHALQESKKRYNQLVDSVTDYIYSVRLENNQVATTHGPGCEGVTGYDPKDYETDPDLWYGMIHEADREAVLRQTATVISGQDVVPIEHRLIHKDGTVRWVRNTPVPQHDQQGNLVGYDGLITDITERKEAETERERLLVTEQEQRMLAETLGEVFLALGAQINRDAILEEILRQAQRVVPYSAANIMMLESDALRIAQWHGYDAYGGEKSFINLEQPLTDFPLDAAVIRSGEPVIIPNTRSTPRWVTVPELAWIRSFIAVPICLQDRMLGLLRLDSHVSDKFSVQDLERLQPLANAAAIALENARLYELAQQEISERIEAEKKASELNRKFLSLQYAGATIASTLDLQRVLDSFTEELVNLLAVKGCVISEWDQRRDKVKVIARYGPEDWWHDRTLNTDYPVADVPITKWVLTKRQAQYLTVGHNDIDPVDSAYMQSDQIKTLLMLPMEFQDRVVGLVEVMDDQIERTFAIDEIALAQLLANQAAGAIENARLYAQAQREIGERRQAEQELRRVAARNHAILNAIPDLLFYLSRDGQILDYKIVDDRDLPPGVSTDTLMGQNLSEIRTIAPSFVDQILHYIGQTLDTGEMQLFEYQLPLEHGLQDYEARLVVSNPNEVLGIVRNITKSKQAEAALKWSEANLRAIFEHSRQAFILIDHDQNVLAFNKAARVGIKRIIGHELREGTSVYEYVPEADIDTLRDFIERALQGETVVIERSIRLNGIHTWFEFHFAPVFSDDGQVIGICFSSVNIHERKKTTEALAESQARLLEEMRSVLAITRALVTEIDLGKLLEFIIAQAKYLTNAEGAAVLMLSDDGQWLEVTLPGQIDDAWLQMKPGLRLLAQGSLAELAIASQQVQVSNKTEEDDRTASIRALLKSVRLHSLLCAPLIVKGKSLGVLLIWNKRRQFFTQHDNRLMSLFADQAALAWHNANLHARNRALAIEQERDRLARELHDSVTQSIYSIGMAAQASLRLLNQEHPASGLRAPIEYIHTLSQTALTEMREQLHNLRSTTLIDKGLLEVLAQHCEQLSRQHDLHVELVAPTEPPLSVYQCENLYFITKEALWNAVKHAGTEQIKVTLTCEADEIVLSIADEGTGFAAPVFENAESIGLRSMKERAKLLGGVLELNSKAGFGTQVSVRVPATLPVKTSV